MSHTPSEQVFISYAHKDLSIALRLYQDLQQAGVRPWLDHEDLLPGQRWKVVINQEIRQSAYVLALLSSHSISKRGFVQKELKKALDVVEELPPEEVFVIPVRVDACEPQDERILELHWVDLFLSYQDGLERILRVLTRSAPCRSHRSLSAVETSVPSTSPRNRLSEPIGTTETFDVFLCHNSEDKASVAQIGERLKQHGLRPWIDVEQLRPGLPWQTALENQIAQIQAAAVCVGPGGDGPWQELEIQAFLRQFVKRGCPVIPVILPQCQAVPALPLFLQGMTWVDFRVSDPDPLQQLIWGITGEHPTSKPQQPAKHARPIISLRKEPLLVPEEDAQKVFGLNDDSQPLEYLRNDFDVQGGVVVDHATGLMWQKSGSENRSPYTKTKDYIRKLNQRQFTGYADWRLPTIAELMSLLETDVKSNGLYINPVFDANQLFCWSADTRSAKSAWFVLFGYGVVHWSGLGGNGYVRAVRP